MCVPCARYETWRRVINNITILHHISSYCTLQYTIIIIIYNVQKERMGKNRNWKFLCNAYLNVYRVFFRFDTFSVLWKYFYNQKKKKKVNLTKILFHAFIPRWHQTTKYDISLLYHRRVNVNTAGSILSRRIQNSFRAFLKFDSYRV